MRRLRRRSNDLMRAARAIRRRLDSAIASVIAEGKEVTYDLKPRPNDPTAVGTSEFADAVILAMESGRAGPRAARIEGDPLELRG